MNMLSLDANANPTLIRDGLPVGGILTPETGAGWHRLMPSGDSASLVADNPSQLNIGTLRADVLDVEGWQLMIYNAGYLQRNFVNGYENNRLLLKGGLQHAEPLQALGANIEWAIYPQLVVPFGITYHPDAATTELTIGVAKDDTYAPTPKRFALLKADQMVVMHTQRLQNIFYQSAQASDLIMWGEHYIA